MNGMRRDNIISNARMILNEQDFPHVLSICESSLPLHLLYVQSE